MSKLLIASTRHAAGKTSIIIGIASVLDKKFGYIKPFGDRLIYHRKTNWDYDTLLINQLWNLDQESENMTLGFSHSRLRYVGQQDSIKQFLIEMAENAASGKDLLFIEGGQDLTYGSSISFDSFSMAKYLGCKMIIGVSGDADQVLDDITFLKKYQDKTGVDFKGVIVNKVQDVEEFEATHLKTIKDMGIEVLGVIPYKEKLTYFTMKFLADKFFARIIAGEKGLNNVVKNIFVGAMATSEALRNPLFNTEKKLIITSGDRSDMILGAIESDTAGIILTNNIVPPSNIISKASDQDIPLLLIPQHTYHIARQMDNFEGLITKDDSEKLQMLSHLAKKYVNTDLLLK
jgi:BioD-like phosphotransacetylase family protein